MTSPQPARDGSVIRTSSFCTGGACVGVAYVGADGHAAPVQVVDTKHESGPVLRFTAAEWSAFVAGVKAGEFDL